MKYACVRVQRSMQSSMLVCVHRTVHRSKVVCVQR